MARWLRTHLPMQVQSLVRDHVGKTPHAAGQLSPHTTTTEPCTLEPMRHNKRTRCNEKPAHCNESSLHLLQPEKVRAAAKPQHSQK